jgi:hypothetical protein
VRQACSCHDLSDADGIEAMTVEEFAGTIDDLFLGFFAMTAWIRHTTS